MKINSIVLTIEVWGENYDRGSRSVRFDYVAGMNAGIFAPLLDQMAIEAMDELEAKAQRKQEAGDE